MSTGAQLVNDAAAAAGVLGQGEPLSAGDSALILRRLNRMLAQWANVRSLGYETLLDSFSTAAGTQSYSSALLTTLGRANQPAFMFCRQSSIDEPIEIITAAQWASIPYKIARGLPAVCWIDQAFHDATLNFYPIPDTVYTVFVGARRPLGEIALATDVALPPGFEQAIVDSLAVDICPSFGRPVTPDLRVAARLAQDTLRPVNFEGGTLDVDFAAGGMSPLEAILTDGA